MTPHENYKIKKVDTKYNQKSREIEVETTIVFTCKIPVSFKIENNVKKNAVD